MTTTTTETVWEQTRFDCGTYVCRVERDGSHGRLTVTLDAETPQLLHEELVRCDRTDTDKWRARCAAVISYPDLRTLDTRP